MKKFNREVTIGILVVAFTLGLAGINNNVYAATSPTLGTAGSYSVLGHTTVTNTGATTMSGDLGISIGGAPTGFPPGIVNLPGTIRNAGDSLAAQNANTAAFLALSAAPNATCDITYVDSPHELAFGVNVIVGSNNQVRSLPIKNWSVLPVSIQLVPSYL